MRKLIVAAFGISSLLIVAPLTAASAADLPVKAPPPVVPTCIWCGWYAGLNLGGSWSDDPATYNQTNTAFAASSTLHTSGGIGGVQLGYNWQQASFVFGLEGDLNARNNSTTAIGLQPFPTVPVDQVNINQTDSWLSTARVRIGWALGNVLLYGTGGVAGGEEDHSYTQFVTTNPAQSLTLSNSAVRWGWTAGAGAEWMVLRNISVGVEYLHVDLGNSTIVQPATIVAGGLNFPPSSTRFENRSDIVRAKLNFYFNEPPVVARY